MKTAYLLYIPSPGGYYGHIDAREYRFTDEGNCIDYVQAYGKTMHGPHKSKWSWGELKYSYGDKDIPPNGALRSEYNDLTPNSRWRRVSKCVFFRFLKTKGITKAQFLEKAS